MDDGLLLDGVRLTLTIKQEVFCYRVATFRNVDAFGEDRKYTQKNIIRTVVRKEIKPPSFTGEEGENSNVLIDM